MNFDLSLAENGGHALSPTVRIVTTVVPYHDTSAEKKRLKDTATSCYNGSVNGEIVGHMLSPMVRVVTTVIPYHDTSAERKRLKDTATSRYNGSVNDEIVGHVLSPTVKVVTTVVPLQRKRKKKQLYPAITDPCVMKLATR